MKNCASANSLILVVFLCATGVSYAQNSKGVITSVRADDVTLMDEAGNSKGVFPKSALPPPPWPILDVGSNGLIKVHLDGRGDFWVKMTKVVTDRPVTVTATCGPQLAQNQKTGATRGIGEECKK